MHFTEQIARQISLENSCGFWKVLDQYCFFHKGEALRFATRLNTNRVTYHFFDEVYRSIDWTKEPSDTLDQLYLNRANQIRDDYDYVMLSFSGGSDSRNILSTFLKNNIHIDEIVTAYPVKVADRLRGNFNTNDTSPENLIFEYYEAVVPMFKWLAVHHPHIKLTVLDHTDDLFTLCKTESLGKSLLAGSVANGLTPGFNAVYNYSQQQSKKHCIVYGVDKPRIRYNKKLCRYEVFFWDMNTHLGRSPTDNISTQEPTLEYFYYSRWLPTITVKQCHVMRRAIEANGGPERFASSASGPDFWFIDSHHPMMKRALYSGYDGTIFQASKNNNTFYNEHAAWFHNEINKDTPMKEKFDAHVDSLVHGIRSDLLEIRNGRPRNLREFITSPIAF